MQDKGRNPQTESEHTLFLKHPGTVEGVMQHIIRLAYFIPQDKMIYVLREQTSKGNQQRANKAWSPALKGMSRGTQRLQVTRGGTA